MQGGERDFYLNGGDEFAYSDDPCDPYETQGDMPVPAWVWHAFTAFALVLWLAFSVGAGFGSVVVLVGALVLVALR